MKRRIICFGLKEKISFDLKGLSEEQEGIEKRYFNYESEIIEVDMVESSYITYLEKCTTEQNNALIFEEINDDNIKYIDECSKHNLVIYEKDNRKLNNTFVKGMINLKQIDKICFKEMSAMIDMVFLSKRKEYEFNKITVIAGYGDKDNAIADIVLKILSNFTTIQNCSDFILTLCADKEMNKSELAYIEDPLKEYIKENSNLIIKQLTNKDLKNRIYFFMSAQ
ncbi:MAG: hypothetical protein PUE01_12565 [Clostridiaceae bacterium]|nr:hypothetical protein [Clostridiaceae bacterium]